MKPAKAREIVIEFEKVQLIRKRARTELRHCRSCGVMSDSVTHIDASRLFEVSPVRLLKFVIENYCHYDVSRNGATYLCVPSLIDRLRGSSLAAKTGTKLLGESNEK